MTQAPPAILCIDDDAAFRDTVSQRLKEEGFRVTAVATGREGIVATWTERFDLMLLDMQLPDEASLHTYQELKAKENLRAIPMILLTDVAQEGWWEELPYHEDGPSFVMGRPTELSLLIARITQLLTSLTTHIRKD